MKTLTEYISRCTLRNATFLREPRRAFTLTELAIVVAIIGGIVATLWAVAADVITNKNVSIANKQLVTIAGNVRAIYAEQGGISNGGDASPATLTQSLDVLRAFPVEMRSATNTKGVIFHGWNTSPYATVGLGNVVATAANCDIVTYTGGPASATSLESCFGITYYNLPQNACTQFATSLLSTGTGLLAVFINGNNVPYPIDLGTANAGANCAASPTSNSIEFVYLLKDNAT